jgi:L-ribulokinase
VQTLADVTGLAVEAPLIDNATSVGAAIHGAVAAGVVANFAEGQARFGAKQMRRYRPNADLGPIYDEIYAHYRILTEDDEVRKAMRSLSTLASRTYASSRIGRNETGRADEIAAEASGQR